MAFTRTTFGISNQHLFYNVDLVVFVEGGEKSFTLDEVKNNFYSDHSIDIIFWKKLFEEYHEPKTIKFKAIGSKSTILQIASEVIDNEIANVYVAMDKDFDEPLGNLIKHKNVLYTFGYSWENDVWNEKLIKSILYQLTAEDIKDELVDIPYYQFLDDVKVYVYTDAYLSTKRNSFFPRPTGHLRLVECRKNNQPSFKKEEAKKLLFKKGVNLSTVYKFGKKKSINAKVHCYGHLFGDFCRHIIHYLLRNEFHVGIINSEIIRRLVINNFITYLTPDLIRYYKEQLK